MRRGNLNAEMQYVKAGLAVPWTAAELETLRNQALPNVRGIPANPSVPELGPAVGSPTAASEVLAAPLRPVAPRLDGSLGLASRD